MLCRSHNQKLFPVIFQEHSDRLKSQIPDLDQLERLHDELSLSVSPDDQQLAKISVWKLRQDHCQLETR